jgi:hypothetical protein
VGFLERDLERDLWRKKATGQKWAKKYTVHKEDRDQSGGMKNSCTLLYSISAQNNHGALKSNVSLELSRKK